MKNILKFVSVLLVGIGLLSFVKPKNEEPPGWIKYVNSNSADYLIGIDKTEAFEGEMSGYLTSDNGKKEDFGSLMQSCLAKDYAGKKVKMSAYIKTLDVSNWAGLWFRVDDSDGNVLSFENMQSMPIKGTTDWKKYEIVLDVPIKSAKLYYGVIVSGSGKVWLDNMRFEVEKVLVASIDEMIDFENIIGERNPVNLNFDVNSTK
jgi:hypothetical protein